MGESTQQSKFDPDGSSPWETESRDESVSITEYEWESWSIDDEYPLEENYNCNICKDYASDQLSELKEHIESEHDVQWGEYLLKNELHRCASCGIPIASLRKVTCGDCHLSNKDRVSCRNCGEVRVSSDDPFCSPSCATQRIRFGDPLSPPTNPSNEWLDHPHRLETGIPSSVPFIENNQYSCRECYAYGSDDIREFAIHVSAKHTDLGWDGYIEKYELNTCRTCGEPLTSIMPIYCSEECQQNDPDPIHTCAREECDNPTDRGQTFCSQACYFQHLSHNLPTVSAD